MVIESLIIRNGVEKKVRYQDAQAFDDLSSQPVSNEIKLIDPGDYKDYFDWHEVGDHLMRRALELASTLAPST